MGEKKKKGERGWIKEGGKQHISAEKARALWNHAQTNRARSKTKALLKANKQFEFFDRANAE